MMTKQNDAVALTEQQLDAVAGGVMADEDGRPCTDPFRHRRGVLFPFQNLGNVDPREMNDGVVRNRK